MSSSVVVAIDFGTTFSGYAYSFKTDPADIKTNESWSKSLYSLKTPTVILLDPNRKLNAFGYEAEEKYAQLLEDDEAKGWGFFRRFKMKLYDNPDLSKALLIDDLSGCVKLQALTAFTLAIRYLKDHAVTMLMEKSESNIKLRDIHFVVTVPAIWDDRARLFMREAAVDAGIPGDQLSLALESEAASVWCQTVPCRVHGSGDRDFTTVGSKYMVVDMGGGTVDITLHQKLKDGKLRELHRATGGSWGGSLVDRAFVNALREVLGKETMTKFQAECLSDVFDLLKEFETAKRSIDPRSDRTIKIRLPTSLQQINMEQKHQGEVANLRQDFLKTIKSAAYGQMITIKDNKLRIEPNFAVKLFETSVRGICGHIEELLQEPEVCDIGTILVVGGFSECKVVQDAIKTNFSNLTVVFPYEPGLAVLKGAVLFGHNPTLIASRKAVFTYGVRRSTPYDASIHPRSSMRSVKGVQMCVDEFWTLVKKGSDIKTGHRISDTFYPDSDDETTKNIELYLSTEENPVVVTAPTCQKLGELHVKLPRGDSVEERAYEISFLFGKTEVMVKYKDLKSNESYTRYFNFM